MRLPTAALIVTLAAALAVAQDDSWTLTPDERERLASGRIVTLADVDAFEVQAAVLIAAPPERIFRTMTSCEQALEFVPHLEACRILERAADGSWAIVAHGVDFSWYLPRTDYVFRAEYEPPRRIRFAHVSGDLREHRGEWELEPVGGPAAAATIVKYRVRVVPRFYVPRWLMRASLRRDLPRMLVALRERCEAGE